jgi:peptidoglycan/LPS O-acetylase OafA/YrhL
VDSFAGLRSIDRLNDRVGPPTSDWAGHRASPAAAPLEHRPDIDGLRGIAVLSVFAVHSIPDALRGGFIGVDVFFVISGYLIALISLREAAAGRFSVAAFYARRMRRLAPALLTVLFACLAFAALFAYPKESKELGKHVAGGAGFVSNLMLWREAGYFDQASERKPLLHLWSLGIEEQFYICWPLLLLGLMRLRHAGMSLVVAAALASFALNLAFVAEKPKGTFFLPPTRFWEILIGVLLAYWSHNVAGGPVASLRRCWPGARRWQAHVPDVLSVLGVALLLASMGLIAKTDHFPGGWALLPTIGAALLIAAGTQAWINRVLLTHPVLRFYGRISYPLYLWHWPLLTFPLLLGIRLSALQLVAVLCASVVLAVLTHFFIEKPLRFGRLAPRAPLWLTGALLLAAGAGTWLYASDGWFERYPLAVRAIAEVQVRNDYAHYRVERCFLRSEQGPQAFADECVDAAPPASELLLLWGDSHAASLYPGLAARAPGAPGSRLAQYTAAACPPGQVVASAENPNCARVNAFVWQRIAQLRPARVVLAANWPAYAQTESAAQQRSPVAALGDTIAALHARGVAQVIVFGPLPRWHRPAPNLLLEAWGSAGELPEFGDDVLDEKTLSLDRTIEQAARAAGARHVSPIRALCEARGCTLSVPVGTQRQAIAFDEAHLTAAGSRWLIGILEPALDR